MGKRPPGPVFRQPDDDEGDTDMGNATTELHRRWKYLRDGAELGGSLVHVARAGSMADLAGALKGMSRNQLEAAAFAMVLVHAEGAQLADDSQA